MQSKLYISNNLVFLQVFNLKMGAFFIGSHNPFAKQKETRDLKAAAQYPATAGQSIHVACDKKEESRAKSRHVDCAD